MSNKALKVILVTTTLLIVIAGAFSGGFLVGNVYQKASSEGTNIPILNNVLTPTQVPLENNSGTPTDLRELFNPFWETWDVVHNEFVKQPVDDTLLMRGAIQGMLDSLGDKHTSYIDPDMLRQANIQLTGEYDGIGAWVDVTTEYLTIISPMPDSPAEKAGLKPEDQVIAIDGEDMTGIDGNVVLKKFWGQLVLKSLYPF